MAFTVGSLTSWLGTGTTSLVIRSHAVEIVSLRGAKVAARASAPIEAKGPAGLEQAIRAAVRAARVKTKRVAVSLLTPDILFRFFTIPVVPKGEWESAVQFEVRKYIPFKIDTLIWDYHLVPAAAPHKMDVVFTAIKRETFADLQTALTAAGLEPVLIEPRSLSLARLGSPAKSKAGGDFVCLVDVEGANAHLAIVKDRVPYFARDISLLSAGEPAEAAEGVPTQGPDRQAQRLLSELSVSLDFFTREYASAGITKVWLFGDERQLGPWCRWVSDQLHCPVDLGTALLEHRVGRGVPLSFASAVGAALAMRTPGGAALDFLSRSVAKPTAPGLRQRALSSTVQELVAALKTTQATIMYSVMGLVLAVTWFLSGQGSHAQRQRLEQLKTSRPVVGWGVEAMSQADLETIKVELESVLSQLAQHLDERVSVAAKLDALARALPDGVWLTNLMFEGHPAVLGQTELRWLMKGACFLNDTQQELSAIQTFEERIKGNPEFFHGFTRGRLEEVRTQSDLQGSSPYQTFKADFTSGRTL